MKKIIILIVLIVAIFIGWKLASPLFINQTVNEDLPADFSLPTEEEYMEMSDEEKEILEMEMVLMFSDKNTEVDDDMNSSLRILSQGTFRDGDSFHKGSGIAKILDQDGQSLLRLEDFKVTNGPALVVLLSENENPVDSEDLGNYIKIGGLKGNIGNQNYLIPDNIDLSKYKSVIIYCEPFHVVFSVATLK